MTNPIKRYLNVRSREWRESWEDRMDEPYGRRRAWLDLVMFDHGYLREIYSNRWQLVPGVFRSAQPSPRAVRKLAEEGIATIVNLRGVNHRGAYLLEREACEAVGIDFVSISISSSTAPRAEILLRLIDIFRAAKKPLLFHCKSGADRAGLAAFVYMVAIEAAPVEVAARQLSLRFLHARHSRTGILDAFVELYAQRHRETGIEFEAWLRTEYDREALQSDFRPNALIDLMTFRLMRRE